MFVLALHSRTARAWDTFTRQLRLVVRYEQGPQKQGAAPMWRRSLTVR